MDFIEITLITHNSILHWKDLKFRQFFFLFLVKWKVLSVRFIFIVVMVGEWRNFIYILFLLLGCILSLYWQRQWCWSGIQWNVLWFPVLCLLSMLIHQVPWKSSLVSLSYSSIPTLKSRSPLVRNIMNVRVSWDNSVSHCRLTGVALLHGLLILLMVLAGWQEPVVSWWWKNREPASIWPHVKSLLTALWSEQVTWPKRMAGVGKLTQSCVDVNCEVTWQRAWRKGRVNSWDQ